MTRVASVHGGKTYRACVGAALALLLGARGAAAEAPRVEARATSAALKAEADELAAEGDLAAACVEYGDSYNADPELEALWRWADCLEREGKVASAYFAFQDAVSLATRLGDTRSESAQRRAAALRPRVSYIAISVPPDHRLPSLLIDRDGFRVGSAVWGIPVATDPGPHRIKASAHGYRPFELTVDLAGDGAVSYVEIPTLEPRAGTVVPPPEAEASVAPAASPSPAAPLSPALPPSPAPPALPPPLASPAALTPPPKKRAHHRRDRTWSTTEQAAVAVGGAGIIGMATSLYFFGKTRSTLDARDRICPSGKDCDPGTNDLLQQLTANATRSREAGFIFLGLGAAATTIGVTLWTSAADKPSGKQRAALGLSVGPGSGRVILGGDL